VGTVGIISYTIAVPRIGERFTEFYILNLEGKAADYPKELRMGEEGKVILRIVNREHGIVNYRVAVKIDGIRNNQIEPLELEHGEKWEGIVNFTPDKAGDSQKVEFLLYKHGESYPKSLHLWIDIKEGKVNE